MKMTIFTTNDNSYLFNEDGDGVPCKKILNMLFLFVFVLYLVCPIFSVYLDRPYILDCPFCFLKESLKIPKG